MAFTLQQLSDIEEIKQTKANYFRFVDFKDWDNLKDCFTEDLRFEMFTPADGRSVMSEEPGRDAYIENLKVCLTDTTTTHQGHCHNITLTSPTTADSWIALEDRVDLYPMGMTQHSQGYYKEKYVKGEDGKWRISRISLQYIRVKYIPMEDDAEYEPLPDYSVDEQVFD